MELMTFWNRLFSISPPSEFFFEAKNSLMIRGFPLRSNTSSRFHGTSVEMTI